MDLSWSVCSSWVLLSYFIYFLPFSVMFLLSCWIYQTRKKRIQERIKENIENNYIYISKVLKWTLLMKGRTICTVCQNIIISSHCWEIQCCLKKRNWNIPWQQDLMKQYSQYRSLLSWCWTAIYPEDRSQFSWWTILFLHVLKL